MKYWPLLVALLAACSSWHWERRGASESDYEHDEKLCKLIAYSGADGAVTKAHVRVMHTCMESKGWRKVAN